MKKKATRNLPLSRIYDEPNLFFLFTAVFLLTWPTTNTLDINMHVNICIRMCLK